jgi:iron complex outermembrane recepter protein
MSLSDSLGEERQIFWRVARRQVRMANNANCEKAFCKAAGARQRVCQCVLVALLAVISLVPELLAADPGGAPDADNLKQLSLSELGNIEVTTPSKEPEEIWRTPAATYVLTQDDIRRSGATSIPEMLRLVPGVEVARINSNEWALSIRGFGSAFSRDVLVLIDGRSVYTPLYAGVYWDVQNVPVEDIERIEVIRGPGGTIWGSNAVNGVINIITKKAKDTRGTYASVRSGNIDQGGGTLRYGGAHGANLDYRMYGMGFGLAPEFHLDNDNYDSWQLGQAGFRTDSTLSDRDNLTVQGDIYKGKVGQQVSIAYYSPLVQQNVDGIEDVSGGNLLGVWQHTLSNTSNIQVQTYYDRTSRFGPQLGETRNTFDFDFVHHLQLGERNQVTWGFGTRVSQGDFEQTVATVDFTPHDETDTLYSTFVQDQVAILKDKLWLTLGSKFEHNNFTGWENQPAARLLFNPTPHQTLWAAVSRAVRTPSRIDENLQLTGLVLSNPPIFVCICDNGKFISETLLGYELGYRRLITPRLYVDVAGFHNKYNDLQSFGAASLSIVNSPPPQHILISVPFANGIMGSTNGGEIAPDWKATRWMELRAAYSYTSLNLVDRATRAKSSDISSYEDSSPHNEVTGQAFFNLPRQFTFSPTYRYVGAVPAQLTGSYQTMDARIAWRFTKNFELSFTGQNLFQPRHPEFGSVLIERGGYGQITWRRDTE